MKISVIVPVYNVKPYLEYCARSVLAQSWQNFELLLVDDGSTDGSEMLCDELAHTHERIRVLHRKNGGPLAARLAGIREAVGDVLLFLDGDDSLRSDALEQVAACFSGRDCDLLLFDAGSCPDYETVNPVHKLEENRLYRRQEKKQLYEKLIAGDIPNCIWLKAVKRSRMTESELLDRLSNLKFGEDLLMTAHLLTVCEQICYLPQGLYRYRIRPGSAVHTFSQERMESVKAVHAALTEYLELWEMPELSSRHNCRKVRSWTEMLVMLLKNRVLLTDGEWEARLRSMAKDPYFRRAYRSMDPAGLPFSRRLLACLLAREQYSLLHLIAVCYRKIKS